MKVEFVPRIKEFVESHQLFKNAGEVGVTFGQRGVSSIIAIIESENDKFVLKIPRSKTFSAGEGTFLRTWEESGVKVPHVHETGVMHDFPYTLMEFKDAPILADIASEEELLQAGKFAEMGKTLRKMHSPEIVGYGFVVDDSPEFQSAEEWLEGPDMKKRFDYIREHNLLESLEGHLQKATQIIIDHSKNESSTYCHDDYGVHNMFATEPITIFDTNPKFNNRYYELGRIVFADIAFRDSQDVSQQLLEGYFDGEQCNDEVLHAYTFLAYCMKCPYWHQTERSDQLQKARDYFTDHPPLG